MRTSAKWTLAVSIVLLIAGLLLTGYGLYLNMDKYVARSYQNGAISYIKVQTKVSGNTPLALCYIVYGYLAFISGLASMGYFIFLAVHPVDKKKKTKKVVLIEEAPQPAFETKNAEVKNDGEIIQEEDVQVESCAECGCTEEKES